MAETVTWELSAAPAGPAVPRVPLDTRGLRHLAFEREDAAVFYHWCALDPEMQDEVLLDRYVFASVLAFVALRLEQAASALQSPTPLFAERMMQRLTGLSQSTAARGQPYTVEWFQGLEAFAEAMVSRHQFSLAEQALQLAYACGSSRFAGIHQALRATEALVLAATGRRDEAAQIALGYALRPYLMPDRRLRPQIYRRLMAALILVGRVAEYRALLWRGLTDVYFDAETRAWFVRQTRETYRGGLPALYRSEVSLSLRLQLLARLVADGVGRLRIARWAGVHRALDWANFALAYWQQYGRPRRRLILPPSGARPRDRVLVTRAMGGLGDLLMMTPGLRALRAQRPDQPIHFAVPRGFFPLFEGNPDVEVIDIEAPDLDPASYREWYDLTDCPAARVESRKAPNVRRDRVQIFASAMGVSLRELERNGFTPRYETSAEEEAFARDLVERLNPEGRPLIGIQLRSAESYRDYPHNPALVEDLAQDCCVLLFDNLPIPGFEGANRHKIVLPLRQSFAVAGQCDLLIAPDSSFVHLGAALGRPVLAIFGPIDGAVRCRRFPTVSIVTPSPGDFPCSPCWRSEYTPCRLTGQRESACLRSIPPSTLAEQARRRARRSP